VPPEEEKSHIDSLNSSLYSRNAPDVRSRRKLRIDDAPSDVRKAWQEAPEPVIETIPKVPQDHSMSFLTKLLIGSIIFCIIAVGIGTYLFVNGSNLISGDNIDIVISGPVSIPAGTPVTFEVTVTNSNTIALEGVELTVNFPAGSTSVTSPTQELLAYRDPLGSVAPGGTVKRTVSANIYGEQNTQKSLIVDVSYKVKGSSSPFAKEKSYDVLINSSPINLTVSSFKEISAGQEFDMTFKIKSNSGDTLRNILVAAKYPFGFTFVSSSLAPLGDKATWRIGDLPPGGEKNIIVRGRLQGEDQENRVFHVTVGTANPRNAGTIGTEFMSATQEIALQKSFMTIGLNLNGSSSGDAAGGFNQPVRVDVSWQNNLPTSVTNAEIAVKLSGSTYDRTLVQPGQGYFRSSSDEIIWSSQSDQKLASIGPGETGTVSFNITPRDLGTPSAPLVNPLLTFAVSVKGKRTQEAGVPESLSSIITRNVRISSIATLSGRIKRSGSEFVNTGPIPPKVDQKTTYTVVWSIDNTANLLNKAQVSANLPQYIKWLGAVSPSTEDVSYDEKTGMVTWSAGAIPTHTAQKGQRKTVAFQISLEPNVNQLQSSPILVNDASLSAIDDFTGAILGSKQSFLTTRFSTDTAYKSGDEIVGQ